MTTPYIVGYIICVLITAGFFYWLLVNDSGTVTRGDIIGVAFVVLMGPFTLALLALVAAMGGLMWLEGYVHERWGFQLKFPSPVEAIKNWLRKPVKLPSRKEGNE